MLVLRPTSVINSTFGLNKNEKYVTYKHSYSFLMYTIEKKMFLPILKF